MKKLKDGTLVRVKDGATLRQIGKVTGETFRAFARDEDRHLYRGGSETAQDAMIHGTAAWGLDLEAMESLHTTYGIKYVELPGARSVYRAKLESLLGPKSFVKEFGGHRPQVFLPLEYWNESRT